MSFWGRASSSGGSQARACWEFNDLRSTHAHKNLPRARYPSLSPPLPIVRSRYHTLCLHCSLVDLSQGFLLLCVCIFLCVVPVFCTFILLCMCFALYLVLLLVSQASLYAEFSVSWYLSIYLYVYVCIFASVKVSLSFVFVFSDSSSFCVWLLAFCLVIVVSLVFFLFLFPFVVFVIVHLRINMWSHTHTHTHIVSGSEFLHSDAMAQEQEQEQDALLNPRKLFVGSLYAHTTKRVVIEHLKTWGLPLPDCGLYMWSLWA